MGVISTIVPIPEARPSSTSSMALPGSVKPWPGMPGESISRWSCASTTPRESAARGPVTVMTCLSATMPPDPFAVPMDRRPEVYRPPFAPGPERDARTSRIHAS